MKNESTISKAIKDLAEVVGRAAHCRKLGWRALNCIPFLVSAKAPEELLWIIPRVEQWP